MWASGRVQGSSDLMMWMGSGSKCVPVANLTWWSRTWDRNMSLLTTVLNRTLVNVNYTGHQITAVGM